MYTKQYKDYTYVQNMMNLCTLHYKCKYFITYFVLFILSFLLNCFYGRIKTTKIKLGIPQTESELVKYQGYSFRRNLHWLKFYIIIQLWIFKLTFYVVPFFARYFFISCLLLPEQHCITRQGNLTVLPQWPTRVLGVFPIYLQDR